MAIAEVVELLQGNWIMESNVSMMLSIKNDSVTLFNIEDDTPTYKYLLKEEVTFNGNTVKSRGGELIFQILNESSWGVFYLTGIDSSSFSLMALSNLQPVVYIKK